MPISANHENPVDDLIVNLKSIAASQVNEKLCITPDGRYILKDERYFQSVLRYVTGDSRVRLTDYIERVLSDVYLFLSENKEEEWKKEKVSQLLPAVLTGLENIKTTYRADKIVLFRLENLIDRLRYVIQTVGNSAQEL